MTNAQEKRVNRIAVCKRQRHFGEEGGVVRGTLARCGIHFSV
jgi:hypothetical protein